LALPNQDGVVHEGAWLQDGNSIVLAVIEKNGNSFVVKDDIEFGYLNVIPLWAIGLNY
jgi:hypothetical protein